MVDYVKSIIVEKIPKTTPEKITAAFIEELQKEKIPVFGYSGRFFSTSYAPNNGEITSRQLLNVGIDLGKTIDYYPVKDYHNENYDFQYGILFTNKKQAGPAFLDFFKEQGLIPARLILVDDDPEELGKVEENMLASGIDFQGLRYKKLDEWKLSFDATLGTIEFFAYLNEMKLMTDDEALEVKNQNPEVDYEKLLNAWILNFSQNT